MSSILLFSSWTISIMLAQDPFTSIARSITDYNSQCYTGAVCPCFNVNQITNFCIGSIDTDGDQLVSPEEFDENVKVIGCGRVEATADPEFTHIDFLEMRCRLESGGRRSFVTDFLANECVDGQGNVQVITEAQRNQCLCEQCKARERMNIAMAPVGGLECEQQFVQFMGEPAFEVAEIFTPTDIAKDFCTEQPLGMFAPLCDALDVTPDADLRAYINNACGIV